MYTYHNGNEYRGAIQWINELPYDAMGQALTYTETANLSSGLEAGNESGVMQAKALADWEGEEMSWHNVLLGVNKEEIQPNLRDEGTGFFKSMQIAFSNLGSDFVVETDHIVQAAESPIDTGEAILKTVAGYLQKALPSDWDKYLPDDWQENKEYANAINAYYADKYGSGGRIDKEKLLDSIAEQPISVALDFYAIKAIATAVAAKAANTSVITGKSTDIAIAEELATYERAVIDKGGLVWHEGMGAWVDSSMIPRLGPAMNKIDSPPVAIGADRSGMLSGTRQHANTAKIGEGTSYPLSYEYPIMNRAQREAYNAEIAARENARKPAVLADDVDNLNPHTIPIDNTAPSAEAIAATDAYNVYEPLIINVAKEEMVVLAEAVKTAKKDAQVVREQWMDIIEDAGEAAGEAFHHSDVVPALNKVHDAEIAHLEARKLNRTDSPSSIATLDEAIVVEKVHQLKNVEDINYVEAYELYNQSRLAAEKPVTAVDLAGSRAADGTLKVATQSDEVKLARNETKMAEPARTSDEIFQSIVEEGSGARAIEPALKVQLEAETIARINNGDFALDSRLVVGDATNRAAVFNNHIEAVNAALITESFNPETLARAERGLEIWTTASNNLKKAADAKIDGPLVTPAAILDDAMIDGPPAAAVTAIDSAGIRGADGSLKVATQANTRTSEAAYVARLERTREIETMLDEYMKADAKGILTTVDKANEAKLAAEYSALQDSLLVEDTISSTATKAQKAKVADTSAESPILALQARATAEQLASEAKLLRNETRMADDAKMAAATQAELFNTGTAQAYEQALATSIANDLQVKNVKTGMLTVPKAVPVSRAVSIPKPVIPKFPIESRVGSRKPPSIPQATPSIPQAVSLVGQRISSATQDYDIPDIPTTADRGIQLDTTSDVKLPIIKTKSERPGWKLPHQFDREPKIEGNYWSADFEDEHWNTPAGVQEAISIWGRPIGNRIGQRWN